MMKQRVCFAYFLPKMVVLALLLAYVEWIVLSRNLLSSSLHAEITKYYHQREINDCYLRIVLYSMGEG
jgi:hypothetical protein